MHSNVTKPLLAAMLAVTLAGCAQLPYDRTTEASAGGAAAGAALGAIVADNELLGAVLGGLAGGAAGYVIGAKTDWFGNGNEKELNQTVDEARNDPATVQDVYASDDADLNNDGLVTRDELIALSKSDLSEAEVINRLQATDQVFHVTDAQRESLIEDGVDPDVAYKLNEINRHET